MFLHHSSKYTSNPKDGDIYLTTKAVKGFYTIDQNIQVNPEGGDIILTPTINFQNSQDQFLSILSIILNCLSNLNHSSTLQLRLWCRMIL